MPPVLLIGAVMALLIYISPAPRDETVVLLPGPDGSVGRIVVRRGSERTTLDKPYAASRSGEPVQLSAVEVRSEFGTVLAALPPRPTSYVLYFITGQDELTDESKAEMRRLLEELRARPQSDILVIGHTDRVGDDRSNDALSLQRAERVKAELLGLGISAGRLRSAGRGEREPLVRTADGVEEPRNRRVEVNVR